MKTTTFKTLKSNGLSGKDWIKHLEKKGYNVGTYAKQLLEHKDFVVSDKGTEYKCVVLTHGDMGKEWSTSAEIRAEAQKRGLVTPPAEVAPLLREALSDKEIEDMGLWYVVVFHEPIKDPTGDPHVPSVSRGGGGRWLSADWDGPDYRWNRYGGWLFLAPQGTLASEPKTFSPMSLEASPQSEEIEIVESIVTQIEYRGRVYKLEALPFED